MIITGARIGGAGLGTVAVINRAILVVGFGLPASSPPAARLAKLPAVVTAAASMQGAGGLNPSVVLAKRALRAKPKYITFVAPSPA